MTKSVVGATPSKVGRLVTIQVFKRNEQDSHLLDNKIYLTAVGILEAYSERTEEQFSFVMRGFGVTTYSLNQWYIEMYDQEELDEMKKTFTESGSKP